MDNTSNLHTTLRDIRIEKGYSQAAIAEKLNISRQAISRWENGYSYPDLDNLKLLSQIYNIPVDVLLEGKTHNAKADLDIYKPASQTRQPKFLHKSIRALKFDGILLLVLDSIFVTIGILKLSQHTFEISLFLDFVIEIMINFLLQLLWILDSKSLIIDKKYRKFLWLYICLEIIILALLSIFAKFGSLTSIYGGLYLFAFYKIFGILALIKY